MVERVDVENWPELHSLHSDSDVLPSLETYFPGAQLTHCVDNPSLVCDQKVPAWHFSHLFAEVSPIPVEKVLGGHDTQADNPDVDE